MFYRMFQLELKRSCRPRILAADVLAILVLLVASSWEDYIGIYFPEFRYRDTIGAVNILQFVLTFDRFNVLVVFCFAGLYTASFCKDDNSNFLKMLLSRVDITIYAQCRFIANLIIILISCITSFSLFVILLLPLYPVISTEAASISFYYYDIAVKMPFLYVGMMGLQFGMIAAATSSVGLLFSSFQPNAFVSIGLAGLVYFMVISYCPLGTPFDILRIISMSPVLGKDCIWQANYTWGILLPSIIIVACGMGFYFRLRWRVRCGSI